MQKCDHFFAADQMFGKILFLHLIQTLDTTALHYVG